MENVNRDRVKDVFKKYTDFYDGTDEKVKLKIGHTYRVADLCERIAHREVPSDTPDAAWETDLAWLLGMLHDVGRFEQLRQYATFIDADSVDHAILGADILFGDASMIANIGRIRDYISFDREDALIETAIRVHSAYRIPENLDERTARFCHILRDADKIDILRVNVEVPLEEIYNTTTEELRHAKITKEVMQSFLEHHAVLRSLKKTPADHIVGHCSLVYELVYPESKKIVKEQGYLERLMDFRTENEETAEQFAKIREEMHQYLTE